MSSVLPAYQSLVTAGELRPDPEQAAAAARLDRLAAELEGAAKPGLLARLFRKPAPPRGVYLWGGVGRGKSMLMDLFFSNVRVERKRRVHFAEFMLEVHARIHDERRKEEGDPIAPVAEAIAEQARLLAFDEMMVTNSPDAMILSRLFTALIVEHGVTVVTTSNRAPSELYKNGLNREHFLPFIALIENRLDVLPLNGPVDYRRQRLGRVETWLVPNGPEATAELSADFFRLTDYPPEDAEHVPSETLTVQGRELRVPKSLKGVAVFSFKKLCGEARGAADYLAIARRYHTIILVGIPKLGPEMRNEAARFVQLIDALYEHKVKLLAAADAEPDQLYEAGDGRFEFQRTVSRLEEMRSEEYMALGHGC
ncbi:cell division protein ZapE [Sphingomonas lenta]|uniref:Cell division protein ZapE n=1 Tax=Sphingomonas lenta TaxID=1141887 RepID=A0A2A2SG50_9SPHN|nr:cell division protein ZapE [Sphingomonas lenta]PAX08198.1 cell division protein ZapE [Sphingomonas lenta]